MTSEFKEIFIKVDKDFVKTTVKDEARRIIEKLLADIFTNLEFVEWNVEDIYEELNSNLGFVLYQNLSTGRYKTKEEFFFLCDYTFKSFWKNLNQNDPSIQRSSFPQEKKE